MVVEQPEHLICMDIVGPLNSAVREAILFSSGIVRQSLSSEIQHASFLTLA